MVSVSVKNGAKFLVRERLTLIRDSSKTFIELMNIVMQSSCNDNDSNKYNRESKGRPATVLIYTIDYSNHVHTCTVLSTDSIELSREFLNPLRNVIFFIEEEFKAESKSVTVQVEADLRSTKNAFNVRVNESCR